MEKPAIPFARVILAGLFTLITGWAHAAGLNAIEVPEGTDGPALKAFVWSPCSVRPSQIVLGPIVVSGSRDCPVSGEKLPLVVISHGHGGGSLNHHDTAEALADAGFIVVALNHPGDNFSDSSRSADISVMVERPTDIRRLIDYMLTVSTYAAKIDPRRVGFFGFSRGGYTGLVLAGAQPDFHDPTVPCPEPAPICGEIRRNEIPHRPLARDPRIKAEVLADPLSFFSTAASLKNVAIPIQLWGSEEGGDGVLPQNVSALASNLQHKPDFHAVPGSAHFAFLAPCPTAWAKSQPTICEDHPDFDRAAFHEIFNAEVLAFFRRTLTD